MSQPASNVPSFTLGQINERLVASGLPAIPQNQVANLQKIGGREDIMMAVADLGEVPEARDYLEGIIRQTGIPLNGEDGAPVRGAPMQSSGSGGPRNPHAPQERPPQTGNVAQHPAQHQGQSRPPENRTPPPPQPRQDARSSAPANEEQHSVPIEERHSVHVYARGKAALCFEADVSRNGFKTIALDAATANGNSFDWGNKTRVQLTKGEIPAVAAVLAGIRQSCQFKNHGPNNNKGFEMERQDGGKVYVKVFEKDKPLMGVPIHPQDLFYVLSLVMKRIQDENPWLEGTAALALVKATQ